MLKANKFYLSDKMYLENVTKTIHLDSHLPYLYMPTPDYTHFAFTLNTLYKTQTTWEGCDYSGNYCRFNTSCAAVKEVITEIPFSIELNDSISQFNLTAIESSMLVDGDSFGKRTGSYCYIPVFHSDVGGDDHWYVGSLFMTQYVIVYDNTPF